MANFHLRKASQSGPGAPTGLAPEFVGQVYVDENTKDVYFGTGLGVGLGSWKDAGEFPPHDHDSDYAPLSHSHAIPDVTGLQDALDGKSDDGHGHEVPDVAGLADRIAAEPAPSFGPADHGRLLVLSTGGLVEFEDDFEDGTFSPEWSSSGTPTVVDAPGGTKTVRLDSAGESIERITASGLEEPEVSWRWQRVAISGGRCSFSVRDEAGNRLAEIAMSGDGYFKYGSAGGDQHFSTPIFYNEGQWYEMSLRDWDPTGGTVDVWIAGTYRQTVPLVEAGGEPYRHTFRTESSGPVLVDWFRARKWTQGEVYGVSPLRAGELSLEGHTHIDDSSVSPDSTWSSQKISSLSREHLRQAKVIDIVGRDSVPPTEAGGDRYILDDGGSSAHPDWDGADSWDIVEFDGDAWSSLAPEEGMVCYVDGRDLDALYVDDPSPGWELRAPGEDAVLKVGSSVMQPGSQQDFLTGGARLTVPDPTSMASPDYLSVPKTYVDTLLSGKADVSHTHTASEITGLGPMWVEYENPDMDGGIGGSVETLVELPCPEGETHTWEVVGNLKQGVDNKMVFDVVVDLDLKTEGYTVPLKLVLQMTQHRSRGDCGSVQWEDEGGNPYSFYDEENNTLHLAVHIDSGSNNWESKGSYVEVS